MMAIIPVDIDEATIIGLILHNLLLCHLETLAVLELSLSHRKNF